MSASLDAGAALVQEGDNVILDVNGEKQAFVVAKRAGYTYSLARIPLELFIHVVIIRHKGRLTAPAACACSKVKVNRQLCRLDAIIGQPYGSMYQLSADTSELVRVKR